MADLPFAIRDDPAHTRLTVTAAGTDVACYVYRPDTRVEEAPKPYVFPLATLSGAPLGGYRPWDHRWHKGLQMTWSYVSGENFWGGPTFERGAAGDGYVWRRNHGRQEHVAFEAWGSAAPDVTVHQRLRWIASTGAAWLDEARTLRFHGADAARGLWAMDFRTTLSNTRGAPLVLGSPTTQGRPNAGYTGLFWRGPRAWTGAAVVAAGGRHGEAVMGERAAWVAVAGPHDERDGGATVLAFAGHSSAPGPISWFVRSTAYACLNPSPAFDAPVDLEPGASLDLSHRFVFADRILDRNELEPLAAEFAL
ncbi:Methane oxygenase PmoA [Actinacidiphila yanglinensis]|uniref:Methane oxygenase PmoA n=1 Tax=Actinacidiphila yanglinensis TaxID=310779 RepID=A0A1H6D9D4_9ACTN|nr:PmoA family protein [Actinacidiphila yanglinensis]SEG81116.1 Methane oxygenase PmoA [Actinacidiphila yanglinensis]